MEREKALAKNTIIIGFGTFLPKVASIITLPIVTGSLTKAEYGTYDLLLTLISLVLPLATLQIQTAAFRFLVQIREKEEECSRVITNIVFFTIVCSIAPIIVIFFLINNYAGYTRVLILFEGERKMEESQVKCEVAGQTNVGVSYHAVSEEWGEMADRTINMLEKIIENAICKMAASTMYRKSPGALAAGGRCLIGCILSRLSGDKKTMRRSRNRKEAEKVKIP